MNSFLFRQVLKNVNLKNALSYLAKTSVRVWNKDNQTDIYQHNGKIGKQEFVSRPYNLATLAYISREVVAYSRGVKQFNLALFNQSIDSKNEPVPRSVSVGVSPYIDINSNPEFRAIQIILTTAYPQIAIPDQMKVINRFSRYWLFYTRLQKHKGQMPPKIINLFPKLNNDLSLEEFILSGLIVFYTALEGSGKIEFKKLNFENSNIGYPFTG